MNQIIIGLRAVVICPYCHRPLTNNISRDHIRPRRRGGTDARENIRLVHSHCNNLREHANDCVGALACAWTVAEDPSSTASTSVRIIRRVRSVLRQWKLKSLREG